MILKVFYVSFLFFFFLFSLFAHICGSFKIKISYLIYD